MIEDYRDAIEHGVVVARPVLCGLEKATASTGTLATAPTGKPPVDTGVPASG
jgi:2-oxoglutarate dehydrogenase E1 component